MRLFIGLLALLPAFCGCVAYSGSGTPVTAQAPVPVYHRMSTQKQMQAVDHWKLLAQDVALQIKAVADNHEICEGCKPIYIAPSGTSVFKKAMHDLFTTELVNLGLCITRDEYANLVLDYDIQVVEHSRRTIRTHQGVFQSLAPGFFVDRSEVLFGPERNRSNDSPESKVKQAELYAEAGKYTMELPKNEILVTVSLLNGDEFVSRYSSIYYIADLEKWHYQISDANAGHSIKTYRLVNE